MHFAMGAECLQSLMPNTFPSPILATDISCNMVNTGYMTDHSTLNKTLLIIVKVWSLLL